MYVYLVNLGQEGRREEQEEKELDSTTQWVINDVGVFFMLEILSLDKNICYADNLWLGKRVWVECENQTKKGVFSISTTSLVNYLTI